jgi:hypothetical protein
LFRRRHSDGDERRILKSKLNKHSLAHTGRRRNSEDQARRIAASKKNKDDLAKVKGKFGRMQGPVVTCSACALKWCFSCHAPWHEGVTCTEYLKGDKQFLHWTRERVVIRAGMDYTMDQRNAQQCPKCKVHFTLILNRNLRHSSPSK